jgi:hypothetical protein
VVQQVRVAAAQAQQDQVRVLLAQQTRAVAAAVLVVIRRAALAVRVLSLFVTQSRKVHHGF